MCGILAIFGLRCGADFRCRAVELQKKLRHRGPDWSGLFCGDRAVIAHERLAIVDPESGDQPLYARDDDSLIMAVNGEIYNHKELIAETPDFVPRTGSDCEALIGLYEKDGLDFLTKNEVCGMFACAIYDQRTDSFVVARDHIGMIPLYYGRGKDGSFWVASEMKVLVEDCVTFDAFPPGHIYDSKQDKFIPFMEGPRLTKRRTDIDISSREKIAAIKGSDSERDQSSNFWVTNDTDSQSYPKPKFGVKVDPLEIRYAFEEAVISHMMSDVAYGVLLSGGLDSSLCASVMSRHCKMRIEDNERSDAYFPRLHSFSIGLKGSPDLKAAQDVAKFIGSVHHGYEFTVQQGIDALSDVIYHIESFDVTTVRSSTPMYLMSRKIRSTGVKMVLSGEGADEIFGGYLYFHKAPDSQEFHEETVRKVRQLNKYDCLRANKSTMAWSVEARTPFLDRRFLEKAFSFDPKYKMCRDEDTNQPRMEKYLLRKAFDDAENPYLPKDVLWRQKEQFSDGVGYTWIDGLQDHAEKVVTDQQLAEAKYRFPEKTPKTKEAYLYRDMFSKHFGERNANSIRTVEWQDSIACSSATALKWDASFQNRADASGRSVQGVHVSAYGTDRFQHV